MSTQIHYSKKDSALVKAQYGNRCVHCGATDNLEAHDPSGAHKDWTLGIPLCFVCHHAVHPLAKFKVGDTIYLNGRTPGHVLLAPHRPRTIVAVEYNPEQQCSFYLLGSNGQGDSADGNPRDGYSTYWFRSYMLHPWHTTGRNGRPREKRAYHIIRRRKSRARQEGCERDAVHSSIQANPSAGG